jgi:hypothetical protein
MDKEIKQSILEVAQAMENLNRAFEKRTADLKKAGNADELERWMKAIQAMRDSGNIYLAWAEHYARSTGGEPASDESELEEFLDEGGTWPINQKQGP